MVKYIKCSVCHLAISTAQGKGLKSRMLSDPHQPPPAVIVEGRKGVCGCACVHPLFIPCLLQCQLLTGTELLSRLPCTRRGGGGVLPPCSSISLSEAIPALALRKSHPFPNPTGGPTPSLPTGLSLSFHGACSPVNQQTSWDPFPGTGRCWLLTLGSAGTCFIP